MKTTRRGLFGLLLASPLGRLLAKTQTAPLRKGKYWWTRPPHMTAPFDPPAVYLYGYPEGTKMQYLFGYRNDGEVFSVSIHIAPPFDTKPGWIKRLSAKQITASAKLNTYLNDACTCTKWFRRCSVHGKPSSDNVVPYRVPSSD